MVLFVTPHLYSPSQIATYRECARKWAFGTIAKIRAPPNQSAALGTETHWQLETYLNGGQLDYTKESGYIAASGVHHLPTPPLSKLNLESRFKFQSPMTGFWYHGIRDVFLPQGTLSQYMDPLVIDHKTTSSLKWAKTPEDLLTDVQAMVYAYSAMSTSVRLRWVYYQTKGARKSLPVEVIVSRDHVVEQFSKIELTTAEMQHILDVVATEPARGLDLLKSLPPSPEACESFGGCPYRHICNLSPSDRLASIFSKPTPTQEHTMSVQSLIERLKNKGAAVVEVENPGTSLESVTTFSQDFINPPPLPAVLQPELVVGPGEDVKEAMQAVKRGPGRPKKNEGPLTRPSSNQPPKLPQTGLIVEGVPERVDQGPTGPGPIGYTLFVDCLPQDHVQDTAFIYAIARKAVCDKAKVADYRLVEYGAGPGLLAVAVEDLINSGALEGNVFVSTACQETNACLSVLTQRAKSVVRGIR